MKGTTRKNIATNRKARFNYHIVETFEAGIVLYGDEVKSLRMGKCSITESFARIEDGEAKLFNMNIPEFNKASHFASEPLRTRKLLLKKREISQLAGSTSRKGYTLVPLRVYFSERGFAKVEIALAQGKHTYDKRKKMKEEYQKREAQRQMRPHR